eukprot:gene17038-23330_t
MAGGDASQQGMGGMGGAGGQMGGGGMVAMGMERIFPSVKLRGLPFDVTEDDIRMFLGCEPVDILMVKRDGRLSGEAHIVLTSAMDVELACSKNKENLGRRYIEDYYKAVAADMMDGGGQPMGGMGGGYVQPAMGHSAASNSGMTQDLSGSTILKLRGMPFSVQDGEVASWFNDSALGIAPISTDSVYVVSENGRPSGIAFVEFPTTQEAAIAMGKNKQMMGSRYIEIFPAAKADLEKYRGSAQR